MSQWSILPVGREWPGKTVEISILSKNDGFRKNHKDSL